MVDPQLSTTIDLEYINVFFSSLKYLASEYALEVRGQPQIRGQPNSFSGRTEDDHVSFLYFMSLVPRPSDQVVSRRWLMNLVQVTVAASSQ